MRATGTILALIGLIVSAHAQEASFAGKTVRMIVGSTAEVR